MSHPDTSWRVAAIYRTALRKGRPRWWAVEALTSIRRSEGFTPRAALAGAIRLTELWDYGGTMSERSPAWRGEA